MEIYCFSIINPLTRRPAGHWLAASPAPGCIVMRQGRFWPRARSLRLEASPNSAAAHHMSWMTILETILASYPLEIASPPVGWLLFRPWSGGQYPTLDNEDFALGWQCIGEGGGHVLDCLKNISTKELLAKLRLAVSKAPESRWAEATERLDECLYTHACDLQTAYVAWAARGGDGSRAKTQDHPEIAVDSDANVFSAKARLPQPVPEQNFDVSLTVPGLDWSVPSHRGIFAALEELSAMPVPENRGALATILLPDGQVRLVDAEVMARWAALTVSGILPEGTLGRARGNA